MRIDDATEDECLAVRFDVVCKQFRDEQRQRRLILGERQRIIDRDRRVVNRQDLDLDSGRDRETGRVGDRVGQRQRAIEVDRWRDAILTVLERGYRRVRRRTDETKEGDGLAVRIIVVGEELGRIDVDIGVFERPKAMVGHRDRDVELGQDGERHVADAVGAVRVGHTVGEGGIAEIAFARREHGGVADHLNGAVVAVEELDDCEAVAFDVAVVGQQHREIDDQRRVLVANKDTLRVVDGADAVGIGIGPVVDRGNLKGEGPRAGQPSVRDRVAEDRRPAGILPRHEAVASAGQALDAPEIVRHLKRDQADRIAIKIAVIANKVGRGEFERRVLVRAELVSGDGRRVVGRLHVDGHGTRPGAIDIIGDDIVEAGLAAEIGIRCECDVRAVETQRAMDRIEHLDEADRITIDIMVVRQKLRRGDDDRGRLQRCEAVCTSIGGLVTAFDGDAHRRAAIALQIVGNDIGEAVVTRPSRVRRVGDRRHQLAIEKMIGGRRLAVLARCRCPGDVEALAQIERNRGGDHASGGVDRHPCRQVGAISQLGGPNRSGRREFGWRAIGDDAVVDHKRPMPRRRDGFHAQIIAIVLAVVCQEVHQREGHRLILDRVQRVGNGIGLLGGRKHIDDNDAAVVRDAAFLVDRGVGERDRAVEIFRRGEVDLFARVADADTARTVGELEAIIDYNVGDDREAG